MDTIRQDLRFAFRSLRNHLGFSAVAVLTLALGIGANTAIFSVVDGVLLRRAPFADADRLMMVWETDRNTGTTREPASLPDFVDYAREAESMAPLAALMGFDVSLSPREGDPVRLAALAVSHEYLPMAGVEPLAGRIFTAEEDAPGRAPSALIGEGMWERDFGRDPDVVGRTLRIDDREVRVVGVLPREADFGALQILSAADYGRAFAERGDRVEVDVWMPLRPLMEGAPRSTHPIFMVGRLAPGATAAAAQRELAGVAAELEAAFPENRGRGIFVEPLEEVVFGPVRPALLVLLGAVALVLLIACANVANLLLARGAGRSREVAVRAALGAGRGRLARQFLAETLALTAVAAVLGVALAHLGLGALLRLAPPDVARLDEVAIDGRALLATALVSVTVALLFGMLPTLQAWRVELQDVLKSAGTRGASAGRGRRRLRAGLVVAETALAVLLLVGAGLLITSFSRLLAVDPGFRADQVLKAEFQLPQSRYPQDFSVWPRWAAHQRFARAALEQAAAIPGVDAVAIAGAHPLNAGFTNSFRVVGREAEAAAWPEISTRQVTPEYFRALGIPLLRGRALPGFDSPAGPPVAQINAAAARRFFPGRDPLGERLVLWGTEWTIVGIVGNERFQGLASDAPPAVYLSAAQAPISSGSILLRVRSGDPAAAARELRAVVRGIDPGLPLFGVEPLRATLSRTVGQQRFTTLLLGLFAALAVLLAVGGVHGVLSYAVAQRTREIGIRMALGASRSTVVRGVVSEGFAMAAAGTAAGLLAALALGRAMESLLFGVGARDAGVYAAAAALLVAVALLASWLPARRATRVEPVVALRAE